MRIAAMRLAKVLSENPYNRDYFSGNRCNGRLIAVSPDTGYSATMSSDPRFIHLRVHTEYSLLEGAMRLKKLPGLCAGAGMPAVAVTDTNNMFSALEFSIAASGAGIQPIIGCQVSLEFAGDAAPTPGRAQQAPIAGLVLHYKGQVRLLDEPEWKLWHINSQSESATEQLAKLHFARMHKTR